ncbi:MAG: purN [Myxococcales bacterium]|nr:purN [Myxococcales bacterium]
MNVGVLVSGSGTNLQAILDAGARGQLGQARVVVVVSNVAGVRALERAEAAGVATAVLPHRQFPSRQAFDEALVATLRAQGVELVALAGFMRIVTPAFLQAFPQRVINVHPALLPAFPGIHAQKQALEYGARITGCSVHFVDEGCDTGPIIMQAAVPVLDGDDEAALTARILVEEHRLYPAAIRALADGRVTVDGRRVTVRP